MKWKVTVLVIPCSISTGKALTYSYVAEGAAYFVGYVEAYVVGYVVAPVYFSSPDD